MNKYERQHQNCVDSFKAKMFDMQNVIDKMAEYMARFDTDEDICKHKEICLADLELHQSLVKQRCAECLKKHFESEVE